MAESLPCDGGATGYLPPPELPELPEEPAPDRPPLLLLPEPPLLPLEPPEDPPLDDPPVLPLFPPAVPLLPPAAPPLPSPLPPFPSPVTGPLRRGGLSLVEPLADVRPDALPAALLPLTLLPALTSALLPAVPLMVRGPLLSKG